MGEITTVIDLITSVGLGKFTLWLMIMNSPSLIFSFVVFGKFKDFFLSKEEHEKDKQIEYQHLIIPLKEQVSKIVESLGELKDSFIRNEEKLLNLLNK